MNYYLSVLCLVIPTVVFANEAVKFNEDEINNIGIEVAIIHQASQSATQALPAQVTIPNKSQRVVSAPQSGVIEVMLVAEGDTVTAGQALVELNSPQLLSSQNDYLQSLSRLIQAKKEMQRDKNLFDKGIIAERRYNESLSIYQQNKLDVTMYKKSLSLAGMDRKAIQKLDKTRKLNSHLIVSSPNDGVVMKQFSTAGQRLSAADPIYQIAQLSPLWLEIHVPLKLVKQIKIADPVLICDNKITGHVIAIGREVHAVDQGVLVRAEINQNTEELTPGEFVQACFIYQANTMQFEVPRSAIFRHEGQAAVFVQFEGGFISRNVEVINTAGKFVLVRGDLLPEQKIVVKGTATVKAAWLGMGGE